MSKRGRGRPAKS